MWATGGTSLNSQNTDYATFAMHWTGSKWNIVSTPNVGTIDSLLNAVIDLSPTDAWAVGDDYNGTRRIFDTLTEHWDGTKWSVVTSPTVGPYGNGLYGVGAVSPNAVWAVGQEFTSGASLTLSLKWNGKLWAHVKSPNLPGGNPDFYAAAAGIPGGTTLWAVGLSTFPSGNADGTLTTSNACALTDSGDDFFPVPLRRADRTRSEPHR